MSHNIYKPVPPEANAAGPCAAASNGEDFPRLVYNVVLLEGLAPELHQALAESKREFPSALAESPTTTARHRELFRNETGALPVAACADAITIALRFATMAPHTPTTVPQVTRAVKLLADRWQNKLTIGHLYFDPTPTASAVAMAYCVGPATDESSRATIGSLGGNRQAYFRLMRHFYTDNATFFRDVVDQTAEAGIRYPYRQEWSEDSCPLRIHFRFEDPARNGWGLAEGSDSAVSAGTFILSGGFLPPEGVSVNVRMNWSVGLAILLQAEKRGVYAFFDDDAQMMISGYALHAAGLIDASLKPTIELDERERQQYGLSDPTPEREAMAAFLYLYAQALEDALAHYHGESCGEELVSRLKRHHVHAISWLVANVCHAAESCAAYSTAISSARNLGFPPHTEGP